MKIASHLSPSHLDSPRRLASIGMLLAGLAGAAQGAPDFSVLVFSKAHGLVHASTPAGIQCVKDLGAANGFTVDATEDSSAINPANLAKYSTIIFLNPFGTVLGSAQEQAFMGYIRAGGGWVGLHAAVNCQIGWAWFGGLLGNGAWRSGQQSGSFPNIRENKAHYIVRNLPDTVVLNEEYYGYAANPRSAVTVLYHTDEAPNSAADHPSVWAHEYDGGRAAYMVWGHYAANFQNALLKKVLLNAIFWTGHKDSPVSASPPPGQAGQARAQIGVWAQKGALAVSIPPAGEYTVCIRTISGRELLRAKVRGGGPGSLSNDAIRRNGIYLATIATERGFLVFSGKISVTH